MPQDILLDENLDAKIVNGDFEIGESTYQHQRLLLFASKGEFKANPKVGVDAKKYLESEKPDDFARETRQEFIADGMSVEEIKIKENLEVNIEAYYKN